MSNRGALYVPVPPEIRARLLPSVHGYVYCPHRFDGIRVRELVTNRWVKLAPLKSRAFEVPDIEQEFLAGWNGTGDPWNDALDHPAEAEDLLPWRGL